MSEEIISNSSAFTEEGKYKVFIHPLKVLACGSIVQVHSHYYQCKITSRIIFISFNGFDNLPNHLKAKISDLTYGLNEIKKVIKAKKRFLCLYWTRNWSE